MKPVLSNNKNKAIKSLRESCKKFLDSHKKKLKEIEQRARDIVDPLVPAFGVPCAPGTPVYFKDKESLTRSLN